MNETAIFPVDSDMVLKQPGVKKDEISCSQVVFVHLFAVSRLCLGGSGQIQAENVLIGQEDETGTVDAASG